MEYPKKILPFFIPLDETANVNRRFTSEGGESNFDLLQVTDLF